jgi:hypothetical protein
VEFLACILPHRCAARDTVVRREEN